MIASDVPRNRGDRDAAGLSSLEQAESDHLA